MSDMDAFEILLIAASVPLIIASVRSAFNIYTYSTCSHDWCQCSSADLAHVVDGGRHSTSVVAASTLLVTIRNPSSMHPHVVAHCCPYV